MKKKLLLFLSAFCFTFYCNAQISFEDNIIVDVSEAFGYTKNVFSADLDGDGNIDVIASHLHGVPPGLVWYKNTDENGTFGYKNRIGNAASTNVVAFDIDNDNDLDILASGSNTVIWYENLDGLGNFSEENIITINVDGVVSINFEDLDGDGDFDVLSASNNDNKLSWYENLDGLGNFGTQQIVSTSSIIFPKLNVEDMDGDGDIDILITKGQTEAVWYENIDGNGTFTTEHIIIANFVHNKIFPKDVDSDGDIDVIIPNENFDYISWFENTNGLGDFGSQQIIGFPPGDVDIANADDFDGDGDIDIIADGSNGGLHLYFNDGNENFSGGINITDYLSIDDMSITDINNDGYIDIITAGSDGLVALKNLDGLANFSNKAISFEVNEVKNMVPVDIDNDGDIDILTASLKKIAWFENVGGNVNYSIQNNIHIDLAGINIQSVSAFDIDNDGDIDVFGSIIFDAITANDKIVWFENIDGQGTFSEENLVTDNCDDPYMVHASDIDNDGDLDILSASVNDNKIAWYENLDGQGAFGTQQIISTETDFALYVNTGDIDNDGDFDVVSASKDDDKIAWYENLDGQGTFGVQQIISSVSNAIKSIDLKDIDNDGDLDILSGSSSTNKVAWFENTNGLGNFSSENNISTNNNNSLKVSAIDVDKDGDLDAVSLSNFNGLVWYENLDSTGTFDGEFQLITTNSGGNPVFSSVDLDFDGDFDFITSNDNLSNFVGRVNWFKNLGVLGNEINGIVKLDFNINGCDINDSAINNLMITSSNGVDSFSSFTKDNGSYQIAVNEGDFVTVISQLPSYFISNPVSYNSNFIGTGNTDTAIFCIEPTSTVNDINISVYPSINDPRPGFDTTYQIVYNNIGTTQLNGSVVFEFDDSKLNFLNSSETVSSQTTNTLTFDFTDLNPFETRTIDLEFNVLAPPTTNIDDVLIATATVNPVSGDNTPDDNVFTLNQTVIGSYDPNDIRVLEGDQITLAEADEYLHYIIRFQNTGTASAINVNVENVLDNKLDWTTMQLESLSHTGRVEITNGNMAKFIFDNINLADSTTDEPNSHGFIAYKIKPKSDVVVGDVFNNTADIFFDFNPAIVTNTVSTEIVSTLSVDEFKADIFSIYPNPVNSILTIKSKIDFDSVLVYDINGRQLKDIKVANSNLEYKLDVKELSQGMYFIEIHAGKSKQVKKFIKK